MESRSSRFPHRAQSPQRHLPLARVRIPPEGSFVPPEQKKLLIKAASFIFCILISFVFKLSLVHPMIVFCSLYLLSAVDIIFIFCKLSNCKLSSVNPKMPVPTILTPSKARWVTATVLLPSTISRWPDIRSAI